METIIDKIKGPIYGQAGGDADTNAAVACGILGAKFGYEAIPAEYKDGLIYRQQLDDVIGGLIQISSINRPTSVV